MVSEHLNLGSLPHLQLLWTGLEPAVLSPHLGALNGRGWWSRELRGHEPSSGRLGKPLKRTVLHLDSCSLRELIRSVCRRELLRALEQGSVMLS